MGYFSRLDSELTASHKELSRVMLEVEKDGFQNTELIREMLFSLIDERKENHIGYSDLLHRVFQIDALDRKRTNRLRG